MNKGKCYETLGLKMTATDEEIKKAYRKQAMVHHPDKGGDVDKFKEITMAYENITNNNFPENRQKQHHQQHPFNPFDMMNPHFRQQYQQHQQQQQQQQQRQQQEVNISADPKPQKKRVVLQKQINITLEEAFKGVEKKFTLKNEQLCSVCSSTCRMCNGNGRVNVEQRQQLGFASFVSTSIRSCHVCSGKGTMYSQATCTCNGTRKHMVEKTVSIQIPPTFDNGHFKTMENVMEDIDLKISIAITSDDKTLQLVNGGDLVYTTDTSFIETIFGKEISIKHPSGETLNINTRLSNKILNNDNNLSIAGKGMKDTKNLYVKFNIKYPELKVTTAVDKDNMDKCKQLLDSFFIP
jgi:DnaJ family protein A protein 2